jgi:phosphoribosylanthranilate isomerase
MRVKICGINSESSFDTAVETGADLLGFVFFHRSPRFVTPRQAAALTNRHQGGPLRVGLFVNPREDDIKLVLDHLHLDKLQIYAPVQTCLEIKAKFDILVCRAVGVAEPADLPDNAEGLDCLLIESKPPAHASRPGGNGTMLDWSVCKSWVAPVPWLLAGGLTADNVQHAVTQSNAPGVDVSSGVESLPGVKSPALIRRFIANAHAAGRVAGAIGL